MNFESVNCASPVAAQCPIGAVKFHTFDGQLDLSIRQVVAIDSSATGGALDLVVGKTAFAIDHSTASSLLRIPGNIGAMAAHILGWWCLHPIVLEPSLTQISGTKKNKRFSLSNIP